MRKLGKKSALNRFYQQSSQGQSVKTNLEKRTHEKINTMSNNDSLTMDFVLKNRKLLEHLKKCKVFLSKSMRKNLLKKYSLLNNPISRKMNHNKAGKAMTGKKGRPKKGVNMMHSMLNGIATSEEVDNAFKTHKIITAEYGPSTNKKGGKAGKQNVNSPGPIFIRLPPKTNKRPIHKRQIFSKSIDKSKLIRNFGTIVFKCHVRVKRLHKSDPLFTRKFKVNRKTVSFMETVEVFGESDIEFESDKSVDATKSPTSKLSLTSTPLRGGNKSTKQSKLKSPKEKGKSPGRPRKVSKETDNIDKESKKQTPKGPRQSMTPKKVKSPVKNSSSQKKSSVNSPQKNSRSPEKKNSPKSENSPKKPRSPKKTNGIQLSLIDGKECYVKLNRSSSLLNLSITSNENGTVDLTLDDSEIVDMTSSELNQSEKEVGSEVLNGSSANDVTSKSDDDVEIIEDGTQNEQVTTTDEGVNSENNLDPVRLENENKQAEEDQSEDAGIVEEDDENIEKSGTSADSVVEESNMEKVDDHPEDNEKETSANKDESIKNEDDIEPMEVENSQDVNNQEIVTVEDNDEDIEDEENIDKSESKDQEVEEIPEGQVNGNDDHESSGSKHSTKLSANKNDEEEEKVSDKRVSTPIPRRGKFDKIDRSESKAVSSSTSNGTKQKGSITTTTLPESSEDLFDLLKSNKLPETEPSSNRIPSPTPDLSDDEGELVRDLNKDVQSPVGDTAEESGSSANDSRFSLNAFFKSKNRTGTESPDKSPPTTDEVNLKNPEGNLDGPTTQEIIL